MALFLFAFALFGQMSDTRPVQSAALTPTAGSISGTVYWDRNGSGFRELEETTVIQWPVYLQAEVDVPNGPIQQTLTNDSGAYTFSDLADGFYYLWSIDSRGNTPKSRVEVREVGIPLSWDIASIGWKSYIGTIMEGYYP